MWLAAIGCREPESVPAFASRIVEAGPLEPGDEGEHPLAAGEIHVYMLDLETELFGALEIDSSGVHLTAKLSGPTLAELATLESPVWRRGTERICWRTAAAGGHRLEVRASAESGEGRYRLAFLESRPATALDEHRIEAQRLHNQGLALAENERSETDLQALEKFRQALIPRREAGDADGEAWTTLWIGRMLRDLKRFPEAEEHYREALEAWRRLEHRVAEAETLYRLGTMYRAWGRFDDALEALGAALPLWRQIGDLPAEADTIYNQGLVYRQLAALQDALDHYRRARDLYQRLGDRPQVARAVNNIAVAHQMLGASDRAIESFVDALAIREELGNEVAQAVTLNNIGWVHHQAAGEPGKAVPYFERALRLADRAEDLVSQVTYRVNLGRARLDLGDAASALRNAEQALAISVRANALGGRADSLLLAGEARLARGEAAAAESSLEQALGLSRSMGSRSREAAALYQRARTRRAGGRLELARVDAEASLAILESVRTDVDSRSLKSTFLAFRRPYYELEIELLVELARRHPGEGHAGRALAASERARARSLLETLAEAGTDLHLGVDPAILAEEQDLHRRIASEEALRGGAGEEQRQAIRDRLEELLGELEAVRGRIRDQSPQYAAIARPEILDLAAIQRQILDSESLLLEYSLGDERSFLFAVTQSSIQIFDLPPRREIEAAARRLYELLTDRLAWRGPERSEHETRYATAATALSELLLGPVAGELSHRRLLIAAEGALHYIPFAALPSPSAAAGGGLLVRRHQVVNVPSASVMAVHRRQLAGRRPASRQLAVLADPVFESRDRRLRLRDRPAGAVTAETPSTRAAGRFQRLLHSRREAETLAAMVAPSERLVALDFAASRGAAMAADLGDFRFVHFATHGVLDSRTPELSALVLSTVDEAGRPRDGLLRLHDVYSLELGAEVVVLSACQTALGKAIRGEGLVGLVRGFLYAGAESVVASLWQIQDNSTAAFMESFYRGLVMEDLSPAAALRQAQLEMLSGEAHAAWSSPYHWAAFVLQGDW